MKNIIIATIVAALLPAVGFSATKSLNKLCKKVVDQKDLTLRSFVRVVKGGKARLSKKTWNKLQVINEFPYAECKNSVTKTVLKVRRGFYLYQFATNDDSCDGGNTYGVIVNKKLQTVATIADGEVYCE